MRCALCLLLFIAAPPALAEPWLCSYPDGTRSFSYERESASNPNCVHHPIESGNVVRKGSTERAQRPNDFPRVDAKTQRSRDLVRREILERELAEEQKALAAAMKQLEAEQRASGRAAVAEERLRPFRERVRLHMSNISNLRKELGQEG